jgi:WD40 repeat protein/beta-lactamase regulating signal transducer with metallopeptidase domain
MSLLVSAGLANALCAAGLALLAIVVSRFCRRPAVLHALWLLVLVKLVTPPFFPVRLAWLPEEEPAPVAGRTVELAPPVAMLAAPSSEATPVPPPGGMQEARRRAVVVKAEPLADRPTWQRVRISPHEPLADPAAPPVMESEPITEPVATQQGAYVPRSPADCASLLAVIWLTGSVVWLLWAARRVLRFGRLLEESRPAPASLQELARRLAGRLGLKRCPPVRLLPGPLPLLVWAVGRPVVFFPARLLIRLGEEEQAALLLHELAHIRRRDHWVRWLEVIVLALYWWYPLAWWARRQMQEREEECCDAWVVSESNPRTYALAILAAVDFLAEACLPLPAVASGLGGREILKRRLTLIMTQETPRSLSRLAWAALLALVALLPVAPSLAQRETRPADQVSSQAAPEAAPQTADAPFDPVQFNPRPASFEPAAGELWAVSFSPDGRTLATAGGMWGKPGELVLWDVVTGKIKARVKESYALRSLAFSPDGKTLATADYFDQTAKVRDAATGRVLRVLASPEHVNAVAFSPDGKVLAGAGLGKLVLLWDLASGQELARFNAEQGGGVYFVSFSPDGQSLISCGFDTAAHVWDVKTQKEKVSLKGHARSIEYAIFSPDGRTIATAGWDHTVKLWDAATGKELATLQGHNQSVLCLAFSPDGKLLASGSGKWSEPELPEGPGELKLWDVAARKEVATLSGHTNRVWSVSFSPDGKTLASASWDKSIRLWDVAAHKEKVVLQVPQGLAPEPQPFIAGAYSPETRLLALATEDRTILLLDPTSGDVRHLLKGHEDAVTCLAFAPGSKTLASGSADHTIKLWDPATGKELRTLKGHKNWVHGLAFSPDGKMLASGGYDKAIRLWNPATGGLLATIDNAHRAAVRTLVFTPDGKVLASASSDRTVQLWDVAEKKKTLTLKGHEGAVRAIAISPDGKVLASAGEDNAIRLWDVASGRVRAVIQGHQDAVTALAFSPRGGLLASGSLDQTVRVWDAATGRQRATLNGHGDGVMVVLFAAGGQQIFSAGLDKAIRRWQGSGDILRLFEGHTGPVRRMAVSLDGKRLLTGSGWPRGDRTLRLWEVHSGKLLRALQETPQPGAVRGPREQIGEVYTVAISPDGKRGLSGGSNNVVHYWDLDKGELIHRLEGHRASVYNVAISPNGKQAASGSRDGTVRLWDLEAGKEVRVLRGHSRWVESIAYSPDGRRLLSAAYGGGDAQGNDDRAICLWDVETGKQIRRFEGMTGGYPCVAWLPDGRRFVTAAGPMVQVWDAETGKEIRRWQSHPAGTTSVSVSPDGKRMLSSGHGGSVKLWDVETGRELRHLQGHRGFVYSALFTPDGKHALTAGGGGNNGAVAEPVLIDGIPPAGDDFAIRLWALSPARGEQAASKP